MNDPGAGLIGFTEAEHQGFHALFDAVKEVAGSGGQFRLVDPLEKLRQVFAEEDDAVAFVQRLVGFRLMALAFIRVPGDPSKATYDVALDAWVEFSATITIVAEPPFVREEKAVRRAIADRKARLADLERTRTALKERLAAVGSEIEAGRAHVADAEKVLSEFNDWRARLGRVIQDGPLSGPSGGSDA
jgi:hypothetical protein